MAPPDGGARAPTRAAGTVALTVLALTVLALAACGDVNPTNAPPNAFSDDPTASPSVSASPSSTAASKVGECFDYATVGRYVIDTAEPRVNCLQPHTAQTVYVGELSSTLAMTFADAQGLLPQVNGPGGLAGLPADLQQQYREFLAALQPVRDACSATLDVDLGLTTAQGIVQASLFQPELTGPTPAQWDAGDRWVRCNLVAVLPADGAQAAPKLLPFTAPLSGLMSTAAFRPCWTGTPADQRTIECDARQTSTPFWLTLTDTIPTPPSAWPGEQKAQSAAEQRCAQVAQPFAKGAAPTVLAWGLSTPANGSVTVGFSPDTWGTAGARVACAIPLSEFRS